LNSRDEADLSASRRRTIGGSPRQYVDTLNDRYTFPFVVQAQQDGQLFTLFVLEDLVPKLKLISAQCLDIILISSHFFLPQAGVSSQWFLFPIDS
jgi:hypothetical protein